jgi:hypothetical protein
MAATSIAGKGSFGDCWTSSFLPMEGWGMPALHAMFEDNDEGLHINTQGSKAFEYLFADLHRGSIRQVFETLSLSCSVFLGLIVPERVVPYAGHPGVSSPESYNDDSRGTLRLSQKAVQMALIETQ